MAELADGESIEVQGSAKLPYVIKNVGGAYSCTCPAWRNQGGGPERRTCKHIRALRGEEAEAARVGAPSERTQAVKTPSGDVVPPPILLAHRWEGDVDLSGWWMSEKLDGVRAYWDGRRFVSRLGNTFVAPPWFVEQLPPVPLDGELWCGRKAFQKTVSIVRREDGAESWRSVRYLVFDAPDESSPFEARLERARALLPHASGAAYVEVHAHERCDGSAHLERELARVEALGGEGLMLRRPGSTYEVGRSTSLLKVKSFRDAEAKVIEHLPGTGKHKGRLGALQVELVDGTRFSVGTGFSDRERESPPPIGTIITFRFQELSDGGVPRFPSYVGVRADAEWNGAPAPAPPPSAAPRPSAAAPRKTAPPREEAAAAPASEPAPRREPSSEPAASAPMSGARKRYFELRDGTSSKFWEIALDGAQHLVRYGKIGSEGQMRLKTFASADAAGADAAKLIAEKTGKGYVER